MEKSVQLAALWRQVALPAFTGWAPVNGLVGRLAARQPQVVLPRRLPMNWALPMMGVVGQQAPVNGFGRSTCGPPAASCPP